MRNNLFSKVLVFFFFFLIVRERNVGNIRSKNKKKKHDVINDTECDKIVREILQNKVCFECLFLICIYNQDLKNIFTLFDYKNKRSGILYFIY